MENDDDLAGALPPSPPPRPVRREGAIGAAMERFDGKSAPRAAGPERGRGGFRPQLAGLATIALIGVVSVPLWMSGTYRHPATDATTNVTVAERDLSVTHVGRAPTAAAPPPAADSADQAADAPPAMVAPPAATAAKSAPARLHADAPPIAADITALPPPPPPPPPPPEPAPSPPLARAARASNLAADLTAAPRVANAQEIVVTSARIAASPGGDWNACTIDDPRRDPGRCEPVARESSDAAAGLESGWQHDDDRAIAAFDRAIAATPRSPLALLNRGLAYARHGDLTRALADLDEAVRLRPDAAQGYFQRAQILRRRGDDARAAADERRAVALDGRYAKALKSSR